MTTHQRNFPSYSIPPRASSGWPRRRSRWAYGFEPGQALFLTAPVSALPLARRIVAEAYKAGAGIVTTMFSDEEMTLARYRSGRDRASTARRLALRGCRQSFRRKCRAPRHRRRQSDAVPRRTPKRSPGPTRPIRRAYKPAPEKIAGFDTNWNIVAYPTARGQSWSSRATRRRPRPASSPKRCSPPRGSTTTIRWAWNEHKPL